MENIANNNKNSKKEKTKNSFFWLFIIGFVFLLGFAAGFYFYTHPDLSIISSSAIGASLLKPKADHVQLDASPSVKGVSSLIVTKVDGVERYLFYDINPIINESGDRIVQAQINTTVYNFLKDAYENPTIGKCNVIKSYLNGTAWENLTCLEIQNVFTDRIQSGWKTFKNGVETNRIEVNGTTITVNFGTDVNDNEELKIGDNSITIVQQTTVFTNSLNNQTTSETNFTHITVNQNGTNPPYDSLVGYWSFDKDTSTTAYDLTVNNSESGTYVNGSAGNVSGVYGNASSFNGINQYINLPKVASLTPNYITISAWVKTTTGGIIFDKMGNTGGYAGYLLSISNAGNISVNINNLGGITSLTTGEMPMDVWVHVVGMYNGSTINIYKNGVFNKSLAKTGVITYGDDNANYNPTIGARDIHTSSFFNGSIDEVMFFNTSLTDAQILAIYNNQSARFFNTGTTETSQYNITFPNNFNRVNVSINGIENNFNTNISLRLGYWNISYGYNDTYSSTSTDKNFGLVGYWHFDSTNGTINYTADSSGFNNDGNCVNMGNDCTITGGYYNNSFSFDGVNDRVVVKNSSRGIDSFSFGGWFKTGVTHEIDAESTSSTTGTSGQKYAFDPLQNGGTGNVANTGSGMSIGTNGVSVYELSDAYMPPLAVYSGTIGSGWNHIMAVYTSKTPSIYVNGVLVRTGLTSSKTVYAPSYIGGGGSGYGYFNGTMDEVMIFNRSLSANEIKELYIKGRAKWQYTNYTNMTINQNSTFTIGVNSTNILPSWLLQSNANNFYTPYLAGTSTFDFYNVSEAPAGDTTSPVVTLISPTNNTLTNIATWSFNSSATDETALSNATFLLWNSTGSLINQTTQIKTGTSDSMNLTVTLPYEGLFKWNYDYNDTSNNRGRNSTNWTILYDATSPYFTNNITTPASPVTYSSTQLYTFNVTWTDALSSIGTTLIEFNGINYSMNLVTGSQYNWSIVGLGAGSYNYRYSANDSVGNGNSSEVYIYTVNQAAGTVTLLLNGTAQDLNITYPSQVNASAVASGVLNLTRDSVEITSLNNLFENLKAGYYNFTAISIATTNYTEASITYFANITKGATSIFTYVNGSRANMTSKGITVWLNASLQSGAGNIEIRENGTLLETGASPLSNLRIFNGTGVYNISGIALGNENYTASYEQWNVTIDATAPNINYTAPLNTTTWTALVSGQSVEAETLPSESVTWYYKVNSGAWVSGGTGLSMSQAQAFAAGKYNVTINATDTLGNQALFTEYDVTYTAAAGGSLCGVSAAASRINATLIQFSASSWDANGAATTYTLTGVCTNSTGNTITFPTFSTISTGTYRSLYAIVDGGTCTIRASGQSCTSDDASWLSYFGNQTSGASSSSVTCITNSTALLSKSPTRPYGQLCKRSEFR